MITHISQPSLGHAVRLSLAAVVVLVCGSGARASEPAQLLMARGVAELHRGMQEEVAGNRSLAQPHYQEALALLAQAAEADAESNAHLLYLKGVTEGRLERWDAAVEDLQAALAKDPELVQAQLEIGIALVKRGQRDDDAMTWLTRAQQHPTLDAAASFYLGIVQLRRQELERARESFARAVRLDPSLASVGRYYQALVELQDNRREPATTLLETVAADPEAGAGVRTEATRILMGLQRGEWPTAQRYQLYASAGLEYDSNVQLAPLDGDLAADFGKESDGRGVIAAGGSIYFWRDTNIDLGGGYDFLQSLHFDLTEFDIQSHRPSVFLNGRHGIVSGGILAAYDYYLRDLNSFLGEVETLPWASIDEGDWGRAELFYRFRLRDFKEAALRNALDSFTHTIGIDQYVYLPTPDRYLAAGYRFENLDARAGAEDNFMYQGNQVWGGAGWTWPFGIATELDAAYRFKNYKAGGRDDNEYRLIAAAHMPIVRRVIGTLAYYGTFNDSNQEVFEYHRHIVSLAVGVTF